jgi:hypothetical protein
VSGGMLEDCTFKTFLLGGRQGGREEREGGEGGREEREGGEGGMRRWSDDCCDFFF